MHCYCYASRALEAETAREREKNKVLFLTQDMHAHANTLNSHFQTSTPQHTESKTYSPDDPTQVRTIAPKETPQKTSDVSDLSAAFLEKRSRIRGTRSLPPHCLHVIKNQNGSMYRVSN